MKFSERTVGGVVSLIIVLLLLVRVTHAGALWRDECAIIQLARMPEIKDVLHNYQHESFPPLFALGVRFYTALVSPSDSALRILGGSIGALLLVAAWFSVRAVTKQPPVILLSFFGLNLTFLLWGTSLRAYGIGSIVLIIAFSAIAQMVIEPSAKRIALATIASVLSVQFIFYNSVLLIAFAVAAILMSIATRAWRLAAGVAIVCAVSAISVLPYLGPFARESDAMIIFRGPVDLSWLLEQLRLALGPPSLGLSLLWAIIFFGTVAFGVASMTERKLPEATRRLVGFSALVAPLAAVAYFIFLKALQYRTREWYYLALLATIATAAEFACTTMARLTSVRVARLAAAIVLPLFVGIFDFPGLRERQSNMNDAAQFVSQQSRAGDLIVVNPWFLGVSFNWYYHGTVPWISCPNLSEHRVHRFDQIKAKMGAPDPIVDVLSRSKDALDAGGSVWIIGEVYPLAADRTAVLLQPAPLTEYGWNGEAYAESWSQQLTEALRDHAASIESTAIPRPDPVNEIEKVPVFVARGRPKA